VGMEPVSVPEEPDTSVEMGNDDPVETRLIALERQVGNLTVAVNSFGTSLQYIVDQVSSVGRAVAKGGIGGLMSQMMGGSKNG
jgi:hypothetical protein